MNSFSTSAAKFSSRDDLIKRASLLFDDFVYQSDFPDAFASLKENIEDAFSGSDLDRWEAQIDQSPYALDLIKKFSQIEGSTELPSAKGQGRMSGSTFPRMGWTLIKSWWYSNSHNGWITLCVMRRQIRCIYRQSKNA